MTEKGGESGWDESSGISGVSPYGAGRNPWEVPARPFEPDSPASTDLGGNDPAPTRTDNFPETLAAAPSAFQPILERKLMAVTHVTRAPASTEAPLDLAEQNTLDLRRVRRARAARQARAAAALRRRQEEGDGNS